MSRNAYVLLGAALSVAACADSEIDSAPEAAMFDNPVVPAVFWATDDGQPVDMHTQLDEPMSKNMVLTGGHSPLYDTDGSRITWGEAQSASGLLGVECTGNRTAVEIRAQGLRPGGVYTGWLVFFQEPGFASEGLGALTAISPIGPPDGSESVLSVDDEGRGTLSAVVPAGAASVPIAASQDIPSCLLDTYEVHAVLAYHQDGNTCGDNPCAEDTFVEQAAWVVTEYGLVAD